MWFKAPHLGLQQQRADIFCVHVQSHNTTRILWDASTQLYGMINDFRGSKGVIGVKYSALMTTVAERHVNDLNSNKLSAVSPESRLDLLGCRWMDG